MSLSHKKAVEHAVGVQVHYCTWSIPWRGVSPTGRMNTIRMQMGQDQSELACLVDAPSVSYEAASRACRLTCTWVCVIKYAVASVPGPLHLRVHEGSAARVKCIRYTGCRLA